MGLLDWIGCDLKDSGEFDATSIATNGGISFDTADLAAGKAAIRLKGGTGAATEADLNFPARNTLTARWLFRADTITAEDPLGFQVGRILVDLGTADVFVTWSNGPTERKLRLQAQNVELNAVHLTAHDWTSDYDGSLAWFCVEVALDDAGDANKWKLRSTLIKAAAALKQKTTNGTTNLIAGPWKTIRLRGPTDKEAVFNQILLDGAYGADLRPHLSIQTLRPNADAQQQWSRSAGVDNFALVDEAPPNGDTDFVSIGESATAEDRYETQDPALPSGGLSLPVLAIAAGLSAKDSGTLVGGEAKAQMRDSGGILIADGTFFGPSAIGYSVRRGNARDASARSKASLDGILAGIVGRTDVSEGVRVTAVWLTAVVDGSGSSSESAAGTESEQPARLSSESAAGGELAEIFERTEADLSLGLEDGALSRLGLDTGGAVELPAVFDRSELDPALGSESERPERSGLDPAAAREDMATLEASVPRGVSISPENVPQAESEGATSASESESAAVAGAGESAAASSEVESSAASSEAGS